ncbi:MAG: beta-ketoacyl synthase N-terminal-like domain-containing protein, partial [Candidatus Omnitrophica bacterium]|nr:beta-ketoacyl synthase N-terminal-like domain-containing protein [Candidatus Omnitrophota bacterium]
IAGASDASIVPLMLAGYQNMKALANGPLLPFDRRRNGFLVGEGAGAMLLESLESAEKRHAKIYGEILGFNYGADAFDPVYFNPDDQTLALTLNNLLKRSGLTASEIDYINLHGTGTRAGDLYETNQLKKAFGPKAYQIPMSSTKSMTGHMLGATGAVEIIATLVAMNEGFIPPTIGLEEKDPACDLDYTPLKARDAKIERAISLSLGFGGHVAAIALGKAR